MTDYAELKSFCTTPHQIDLLDAVIANGGIRPAAKKLNIAKSAIDTVVKNAKIRAAKRGHSPEHDMTHVVPEGYKVRGVSTYYDSEGKPHGQWVKSALDSDRMAELMEGAYKAMSETLPRELPVTQTDRHVCADLLNLYVVTDAHVGGLSWAKETGEAWDLAIAEHELSECFKRLIQQSPPAKDCLIVELGDFLHFDGLNAETPTAHNLLDSDGRFSKVVQVAIRVLRRIVSLALERHEKVTLVIAEGNHDLASSVWLRQMFSALLENEPRIEVADSEGPYYAHRHGNTLLSFHHGHLKKMEQLPLFIASEFAKMWGETKYRYCHTGHFHSMHEKECQGISVIQHRTLAARDSHTHRHGWISNRDITSTTYHNLYGQVARTVITPEMIR